MYSLPLLLPLLTAPSTALPRHQPPQTTSPDLTPLPLIIWHGLGDSYQSSGLSEIASLAASTNPDTYIHIIHLSDSSTGDRQASFLGNVTEQVDAVCEQLASEPIVGTAPAINALGFSQGGQFLRAYVERCNNPPVRNLVTVGSQHNGISEFQECMSMDLICKGAEALLHAGVWSDFVQGRFVPAQYFRDPDEEPLSKYLESSNFLADINNEREDSRNEMYKENLKKLNKFAMIMFEDDSIAHPKESAWFAEVNGTTGEVTPLKERGIYKEDWLGLKELDEQGKLDFLALPGDHLQMDDEQLVKLFKDYFGPVEVDLPDVVPAKGAKSAGKVLVEQY
ncbi:palmitoyl-protein thioesterase family protein [Aspergillus glaucus CBS 516.65]|uniref:Palmitoyl-protein thioesterase 1 n=1 Tax=Aspergillus glaucus CBS 516.65 TaxID=1160497 RepID=A0A1L9V852_ASPGL|nr:hypothetical protein ASPGLDRAFT_179680 [Aspergillus glaucus CBS 516.65]OJJ80022.1 hypothetical protein ASPGLDRAFT_179680 [Aspergillus glaucus CBS 516.65]